jgi:hypothetical protein
MFPMCQSSHVRLQSQQGVSVHDANRVGYLGCQVSSNDRPVCTALLPGYQIGILRGARSFQVSCGLLSKILEDHRN